MFSKKEEWNHLKRAKKCLTLFPAGTIVRDAHDCESPTHREQGLKLRRI